MVRSAFSETVGYAPSSESPVDLRISKSVVLYPAKTPQQRRAVFASTSDKTLNKAVSVEWWRLYADCKRGIAPKYSTSCFTATLSTNFETKVRLDIGL